MRRKGFYFPQGLPVRHRLFLVILLFFALAGLQAQVFRPNADNVFVDPGGSARWNVLSNDELGTDHWSEVKVTIETYPLYAEPGSVEVDPALNLIRYIPADGFRGRDSLEYAVYSPKQNVTKTAWVYINVTNQPDNIYTDMCTTPPPAQEWGMTATRTNEINLAIYQVPIVGDIDGDGVVEILVGADPILETVNGIERPTSKIAIYKGNDITQPPKIINTVALYSWTGFTAYGIVRTNPEEKDSTLIVVAESDLYLRAYNYNGDLVWTSDKTYHSSDYLLVGLGFADFNRDGIPEIMLHGSIFDSRNGKLLCKAPIEVGNRNIGNNSGFSYAAELFNDGQMYFVYGNYIYKPNDDISDLVFVRKVTPVIDAADPDKPNSTVTLPDGGYSSLVDIDNDGFLDLIVSLENAPDQYTFIYIADPATGQIKASKYIPYAAARSYPFVGDIDGDGYPEIVCIKNRFNGNRASEYMDILAYKYVKGNPILQQFWKLTHSDASGGTGITLFDFNQDGIAELVYRDETDLRIINGSGIHHQTGLPAAPYNLTSIVNTSGTGQEYATVADIDGDGQAEILIVGAHPDIAGTSTIQGPLWIYKSEHPDTSPWAPARKVWNRHTFNPVYINEDLTVPSYPLNPATEFITKTGKRHRPYNHFLQQVTILNDEGEPLFLAPDIAFAFGYPASTVYVSTTGMVEVTIFVVNEGNDDTAVPMEISVYAKKSDGTYVLLHTESYTDVIAPGVQKQIDFTFPYIPDPTSHTGFEIRLNEVNGNFIFSECLTSNNYAPGKMFSPDERVICEGETERIELQPQGVYKFLWYDASYTPIPENVQVGNYKVGTNGETLEITKNSDEVEIFYLMLQGLDGSPLSLTLETMCVYLTPDSLIWTGIKSADWHNYANWLDPNDADPASPAYPNSKIPRKCTHVLIPDGLLIYPDLSDNVTTYYYYPASECGNITFEHGGEVVRTDSLDYEAAYIHQQLLSNRWSMLSAPLQDFYPGDYYIKDPNPLADDVFVYTGLFSRANPETGQYVEGAWTGTFNNPDFQFGPGTGYAVWVDDKQPDVDIHAPFDFYFPKTTTSYVVYTWDGRPYYTRDISRVNPNRFVYEPASVWNRTTGEISLPVSADAANKKVLVGNPFMCHWDFAAFQSANPIKNYYQILDGNGQNFMTYLQYGSSSSLDPGIVITTANPPLEQYIAPMQSILVESTGPFSSLQAHVTQMTSLPDHKLRSTGIPPVLFIDAEINGRSNRTALVADETEDPEDETGIYKVLLTDGLSYQKDEMGNVRTDYPYPINIYTCTESEKMFDILFISGKEEVVPIGITTLQKGKIKLSFEGIHRFFPARSLYLADMGEENIPVFTNLRENHIYEFEKEEEELFLTNRFFLHIGDISTGWNRTETAQPAIRLFKTGNGIQVNSSDGEEVETLLLTDLQGRVLYSAKNITQQEINLSSGQSGIYIIRCVTRNGIAVFKIHH